VDIAEKLTTAKEFKLLTLLRKTI